MIAAFGALYIDVPLLRFRDLGIKLRTQSTLGQDAMLSLQIEECKGHIIEAVKYCDEAEGDQSIPEDAYDDAGELDAASIFCAKCLSYEAYDVRSSCTFPIGYPSVIF